ncbi:hypothetical protein O1Q96_00450 (plasmid) [Streptomyces sp. Qhu-G9]|uniref:hypothetical protein n=1 Tax=Streptomyces sp. Qhu-G9 TaxID=3452799 RepID=UPI0022AC505F|nr:hypothetical protein [Streptomyces aurantiacus]WAU78354.1 hypothetical protein O1Q96_00450 [Streptomyces aurantiacus]
MGGLLDLIDPKLTGCGDRAFLDAVRNFTGTPDQLYQDTKIKAATKTWLERNLTCPAALSTLQDGP